MFTPHEIQRSVPGKDASGNNSIYWVPHLTVMGRIRQLSNSERFSADGKIAASTHRLYCELSDIKEIDSVMYKGRRYKFTGHPNNVMDMDEFLQIDCELIGSE